MPKNAVLVVLIAAAAMGLVFAGLSTYDFVAHLDRQVHAIHCSFVPGMGATDTTGSSGCYLTLMSPYSSIFRQSMWGGLPISLPAMAVFAFLLHLGVSMLSKDRQRDPRATGFLVLATGVPLLTSIVMGYLAIKELDAFCKICVGIYAASALSFGAALMLFLRARRDAMLASPGPAVRRSLAPQLVVAGIGVGYVLVATVAYASVVPDFSSYAGSCGSLRQPSDPQGLLVPIGPQGAGARAIEVLDPLCPACRGFEERIDASGLDARMQRKALLFPLDNQCNWMVDHAIHPGACAVTEAILCAGGRGEEVLRWALSEQQSIRENAARNPATAAAAIGRQFPELRACIGSASVRARVNRSLRWAVANQLPVLTPQLYVEGKRLCDADTDLGVDFTLSRLLDQTAATGGTR